METVLKIMQFFIKIYFNTLQVDLMETGQEPPLYQAWHLTRKASQAHHPVEAEEGAGRISLRVQSIMVDPCGMMCRLWTREAMPRSQCCFKL